MAMPNTDETPAEGAAAQSGAAPATNGQQRPLSVRFDDNTVTYASQFLVNASPEELIVGFSSGVIDSGDGRPAVLPVQSRIAMSR